MSNALATRIDRIQESSQLTAREIAQLLRTTPETISRWRGGKFDPQPKMRDSLLQLEWLVTQLSELYGPQEAHLWLFSAHKLFDGRRAVDLIEAGQVDRVLAVIAQLKDGAYS